ncbi:DMT family transporter [Lampropedia puyangensis]|uniref:DMT family transporter n=1 Tax=Lampropedia puyangensis TaxID=1330072 RepID=A0A4S8EX94_9BURK|nr:DMT family transporter [Lampropedia puyangensis]THT98253.1 DMT family transporter [Lampropedia puyangensis]
MTSPSSNAASPAASPMSPGLLLVLALPPLFWAGNFIVGRAMSGTMPPIALSFLRWVIALLCLLPFAWRTVLREKALYWRNRWRIVGVSIVGVAAFNTLVYTGLQSTTATNGILLNSFIPILIVLLGALLYRQRLAVIQAIGLALSFAGVLTIITHGEWARVASFAFGQGDLIIFSAMVCWAVYTLWLRAIPADINRLGLLVVQMALAIVALLPLYLWEASSGAKPVWTWQSASALLYIGIFPSVLAYLFYNWGVARAGAARAGLFIHLMPVFGTLLSVAVLGEQLHLYHAVGMLCIVGGLLLSSRK